VTQEFRPTSNEESLLGGSRSFGATSFSPSITNLTGAYKLRGHLQRVGRILHFAVLIEGNGGAFTLASSVLSPPVKSFKRTVNSVANTTVFKGICHQSGATLTTVSQNTDGTFNLANETRTGESTWITGYYWVE
jgi:hypothetical protein